MVFKLYIMYIIFIYLSFSSLKFLLLLIFLRGLLDLTSFICKDNISLILLSNLLV